MPEHFCRNCINAIRSRGEKIFVGSEIDYDEYYYEHGKEAVCDFCEEAEVDLYEVMFP